MNFRTVSDLFGAVRRNAWRIPADVDLVVGIPRSGILAACAVGLAIHKPFTDLTSFLEGRIYSGFSRRTGVDSQQLIGDRQSIVVVDDSIFQGGALREARQAVEASGRNNRVVYAAVYGLSSSHTEADIILERCPAPRVFEWNVMNHWSLEFACVDLDGVLCADPTAEENDDGPNYIEFMKNARLLNAPRYRINAIVTARLEKYRSHTEEWLSRNNIQCGALFMLDLDSAKERARLGAHGEFKARIYKQRKDCLLFIESERHQALEIRANSGKSVLAYRDMEFFSENSRITMKRQLRQRTAKFLPEWSKAFIKGALHAR